MDAILVSFIISYLAGKIDPLLSEFSRTSAKEHLEDNFRNALWNWLKENEENREGYGILTIQDLQSYLASPSTLDDPEINELLHLLKEEIYQDEISKAALDDYQHTQIHKDVKQIKEALSQNVPSPQPITFKKKKDIETLTSLMEAFSFHRLDEFCLDYPTYIHQIVVGCYDVWTAIMSASTFHIYDEGLRNAIQSFYSVWSEITELGVMWYSPDYGTDRYKFYGLHGDLFQSKEAEKVYGKLVSLRLKLHPLLRDMATYIQSNYEIDLDACALKAFRKWDG